MKRSIFILFILSLVLTAGTASAQFNNPNNQSDIEISTYPDYPSPNEVITVVLTSYTTNINLANISWNVNGKIVKSGRGEKSIELNTGNAGTITNIRVSIQTVEGLAIEKTLRIKPVGIDLVWQSESYTPPFYRGKALFSAQNKITFIAIPHFTGSTGAEVSPKNLLYKWKQNGKVLESDSGYGKNTLTIIPSIISRPFEISVEVSSATLPETGFKLISMTPTSPFVLFYKKSPLYGLEFQKAILGELDMAKLNEVSIVAIPMFFGTYNSNEWVSYNWSINGVPIDNDTSQSVRVFRKPEGISGVSNISVSIGHSGKVLQLANSNFNLKYSGNSTE